MSRNLRPIDERWGPAGGVLLPETGQLLDVLYFLGEQAGCQCWGCPDDGADEPSGVVYLDPAARLLDYLEHADPEEVATAIGGEYFEYTQPGEPASDGLTRADVVAQVESLQAMVPEWREFQKTCGEKYLALRVDCQ